MQRITTIAPSTTLEGLHNQHEILQPIRAYQQEADVDVPRQRAITTGIFVGITSGIVVGGICYLLQLEWQRALGIVICTMGIVGALSAMIWWFIEVRKAEENIYRVEAQLGYDISGDGHVGRPPRVKAILINPYRGRAKQKQDLQKQWQTKFAKFVRECFESGHTDAAYWIREGRINGNDYNEYKEKLLAAGYAYKLHNGPTSGWRFNLGLTAEDVIDTALRLEETEDESSPESPTNT